MLQSKFLTTALLGLSLVSSLANAVPTGKRVERILKSPGARLLMDEEVQSWKRSAIESKKLSIHNDVAVAGTVVLRGTPSPAQKFSRGKLIPCNERLIGGGQFAATRNSCDVKNVTYLPVSLPNQDQAISVAPGYYIVGFENSIAPGFILVKPGEQLVIELQQIPVPAGGSVKIYRDLNSLVEQFKMYFSTYVLGESVFKLADYSGDLYIKAAGTRDGFVPLTYKACEATKLPVMTTKGARICKAWNMGTFMVMTEMFNFASNSTFSQWEVDGQGKPYPYSFGRLLVANRTTAEVASFVNVLPGQYVVEVTGLNGTAIPTSTGAIGNVNPANALAMSIGWTPAPNLLLMNSKGPSIAVPNAIDPTADPNAPSAATLAAADDGGDGGDVVNLNQTCSSSKMWRTERRAYCTTDSLVGCERRSARMCEPMFDTP